MTHEIFKINAVNPIKPYIIKVTFDNGETKTIDLAPVLYGPVFGPLRAWSLFQQVKVNTEVATIEWPNGADFDPETLYY